MSEQLGRLVNPEQIVIHDAPEQTVSAILTKQDEIIDLLKALTAKIDADSGDTGGDADYSDLTAALNKVSLSL